MKLYTSPRQDGFYMPAEFAPHDGCLMIWPERADSWQYGAYAARRAFLRVYLLHDILHAQSQYHGHAEQECDDSPDAVSFLRLPGFHDVLLPFLVSYCLSVRSLPRRCPPAAARRGSH